MKLKKWMFFLLLMYGLVFFDQAFAYPTADYFDFPIGGYNGNDACLKWGGANSQFSGKHVADDYCAAKDTQVKAIAKGRVKYIYDNPNDDWDGWFSLVVIEHTLYNGSKICSIYGHVKATDNEIYVGKEITYIGQPIGAVVDYPPSSEHIHFGIYNGAWQGAEGADPFSWLKGYVPTSSWPGNYLEPVSFVNFHQNNNPSYFPYPEHSVIKFSDSPYVYYYSKGWLWHISNELTYALLGYNTGSCRTANFNYLINLSASQRSLYAHLIRGENVPSQGMVAKIANQIGPNTCLARDSWRDPNSVYVFDGSKFRPILNEATYKALGYQNNWIDVGEITQSLFNEYGEGYVIDSPDDAWWIQGPGGGGYLSAIPAPYSLQAEVLSSSSVKLDFYVPWIYTDFGLYLYQDGVKVSQGYAANSITISNIPPNTTHCFKLSSYILATGEESAQSNQVCATTLTSSSYDFVNSYVCDSWAHGSGDQYWNLQPVNVRSSFSSGATAQFLVKLENVHVNHRFRMQLNRNGSLLREQTDGWLYPDPTQGWAYSSFAPYQQNLMPGNYEVIFSLDIGNGFNTLNTKTFSVTGANYEYPGAVVCAGWVYGSGGYDYWDLQPVNPRTQFNAGETVYVLAQLNNVFVDHEWKMEVWKNGTFQWDWPSGWVDVDNNNGWGYSNFAPYLGNASPGNYEFKIYLNTGSGFSLIDTKPFTVASNNQAIPYIQNFTNGDDGFVEEDHLSTASLYLSDTAGFGGGKCLVLNNTQPVSAWQVQAKKTGFQLNQGVAYQGEIKIRGDASGTIYIAMERAVSPWDNIGLWKTVNVTTGWQTIDLDFTTTGNPQLDPDNIRFTIQAGGFVGNLFIDDVNFQ